ncbi:MAG: RnfABCDGE type electron transport complex subunit G [Deltaproteobacteria bacterium]|nr:RnfABCDGE type electron transport complex subunit G [Deltaproteobacteria bacterium]
MSEEMNAQESGPEVTGTPVQEEKSVSSVRLFMTLAVVGALSGLLLVLVNEITLPHIEAYKALKLKEAVTEVLQGPARYDTWYLIDGELALELSAGLKPEKQKAIYVGYGEAGEIKGIAMARGESGFQDIVKVIFGFDPEKKTLMGMKVLESKETPGLGDKIYKDQAFVDQFFDGPAVPLQGVKKGAGKGEPNEVDMITGATISSRAVIRIINNALDEWEPHLGKFEKKPVATRGDAP